MYKVASATAASKAHRGKLSDWVTGEQHLTDEEKRGSLQAPARSLEARIKLTTNEAEKRRLGQEKHRIQEAIHAMRPPRRCPDAVQHFIDVAREVLSKSQFRLIMHRAAQLAEAQKATETPPDTAMPGAPEVVTDPVTLGNQRGAA